MYYFLANITMKVEDAIVNVIFNIATYSDFSFILFRVNIVFILLFTSELHMILLIKSYYLIDIVTAIASFFLWYEYYVDPPNSLDHNCYYFDIELCM